MLEIRYHDAHMRYGMFPYTTEAGPSLPLLPHPALLRAHVRTRLTARYGRTRLAGRLTQRLAALAGMAMGWPSHVVHLPEGRDFWIFESACLRLMEWRMQRCLCLQAPHLTRIQAYVGILPMLQAGYAYGIHWRRRPLAATDGALLELAPPAQPRRLAAQGPGRAPMSHDSTTPQRP